MVVFQVSRNFDPAKEILKIMKVIILRKMHVTIKYFVPPFFNHFSLNLNRKKRVAMRAKKKKLNIFTLQLPSYYILE